MPRAAIKNHLWPLLALLLLLSQNEAIGQCTTTPPADETCASCTEATDGETINGVTRCVTGSKTFNSNYALQNGAKLIVCGTLDMNQTIMMNSNNNVVHIADGGSVTHAQNITLNGDDDLIVYGDFTVESNNKIIMNSDNNRLMVYDGGTVTAAEININSSNDSVIAGAGSTIDLTGELRFTSGNICMEEGVAFDIASMNGNPSGGFHYKGAGGDYGCFGYSGNVWVTANFTNTTGINVCIGASATGESSGSSDWGAANTNTNCAGCTAFLLPVELIEWSGSRWDNGNMLRWVTAVETNSDYFIVERSVDGVNFDVVAFVPAAGHSSNFMPYYFLDENPGTASYYRLKEVDVDGIVTEFDIINIQQKRITSGQVAVHPNPVNRWTNQVKLAGLPAHTDVMIEILSATGATIVKQPYNASSSGTLIMDLTMLHLAPGTYLVQSHWDGDRVAKRLVVTD